MIDKRTLRCLAGLGALTMAIPASADFKADAATVRNVPEYVIELDNEQLEIERLQREVDRRQEALDRRRARLRSDVDDASWRFRMLDADGDRLVSETEAASMPAVARRFSDLDANDDGSLSVSEFRDIVVRFRGEVN